jgi:hypothetical protein
LQNLYCERLRLSSQFLANPHMIILSNRSGLIDSLWLRFGNKNFGAKHETFKGAYL